MDSHRVLTWLATQHFVSLLPSLIFILLREARQRTPGIPAGPGCSRGLTPADSMEAWWLLPDRAATADSCLVTILNWTAGPNKQRWNPPKNHF